MNEFIKLTLSTFLLILWGVFCTVSQATEIGNIIFDSGYWKSFNWQRFESSAVWTDSSYELRDGSQGSKGSEILEKFKETELHGMHFSQSVWRHNVNGIDIRRLILAQKEKESKCNEVLSIAKKTFGKKYVSFDYKWGIPPLKEPLVRKVKYQWSIGNTSIQYACIKMIGSNESATISFGENIPENIDPKPINLTCSGKISFLGKYNTEENRNRRGGNFDPIDMVILLDEKTVTDIDGVIIGVADSITDNYIEITQVVGIVEKKFQINRKSGGFTGMGRDVDTGERIADFNGVCEKPQEVQNKF